MRILLDTNLLIWALAQPVRLSRESRALIEDSRNEVLFSAASIWEIAIKSQISRRGFEFGPDAIANAAAESGLRELPVRASAAARVAALPMHHRDPFDRILVAQAIDEPAHLFTVDRALGAYGELVTVF